MSGSATGRFPRGAAAAAAIFVVLVALAFAPVVSGARTFFHLDLYYEHLPVWAATQKALLARESPFWLDGEYCGHPTLFLQEAPLLYPPTVPLLLTGAPVHRLADLFTLLHLVLAGLAVFLLVREISGSAPAALFGGTAWMLSARMVQSAIWPNAAAVSALVPLGLWGVARIANGRRRSGVLVAAAAGGLALDAGRPQVLIAAAPWALALAAALVWRSAHRTRALRDFGLAAALALALGAPSVLPSAALLPETSRSRGLGDAADHQPLAHGRELDMLFLPVDGPGRWPETAAYDGVLPLVLFVAGGAALLLGRRFPRRAELAACWIGAAAALALAFGDAGPYRWVSRLPLLRGFRVPERFLLSWGLALAVGAALVLAAWMDKARPPAWIAGALLVVLAGDLVAHAWRAAPTARPDVYAVVPDVVPELRARLSPDASGFPRRFRSLAFAFDATALPDRERARALRDAGSLQGALGLRWGLETSGGAGPTLSRTEETVLASSPRAFALGGVSAVLLSRVAPDGRVDPLARPSVERVDGLDRAFVVGESVVVPPEAAVAAAASPRIDPRRTVVLEGGDADAEPLTRSGGWDDAAASVRVVERAPSRVAVAMQSPGPGYLVLLDSWEAGWSATVDGASAPVLRADGAFRAVRVGAGAHRVSFTYFPRGLKEGIGLGVAGVLGLALAALRLPAL